MLTLVILSALVLVADVRNVYAVDPAACFAPFRWDDCGMEPKPVMYYWKAGSRCEVGIWRGCLPNINMFPDEYECVATCIFAMRAGIQDYHSFNELEKDSEETTKDPYETNYPDTTLTDEANDTDHSTTEGGEADNATTDGNKTDTKQSDGDGETVTDDIEATDGPSTEGDQTSPQTDKPKVTLVPVLKSFDSTAPVSVDVQYDCEGCTLAETDITCKDGLETPATTVTAKLEDKKITISTTDNFKNTDACVCMAKFTFSSSRKNGDKVVEKVVAAIDNAVVMLTMEKKKSPEENQPLVADVKYECAADCAESQISKVTENGVEIKDAKVFADAQPDATAEPKQRVITFTITKDVRGFEGVYQVAFKTTDPAVLVTKTVLGIGLPEAPSN